MAIAENKQDAVKFSHKYGVHSIIEVQKKSPTTIYNGENFFREGGKLALRDRSRCLNTPRKRKLDDRVITVHLRIVRYAGTGQGKVHVLTKPFCQEHQLSLPSPRTIARLIQNDSLKSPYIYRKTPRIHMTIRGKMRKSRGFEVTHSGHCIAPDTVVKQDRGCRQHILTAIDLHSRLAFAAATPTASSKAAAEFLLVTLFEKAPLKSSTCSPITAMSFMAHLRNSSMSAASSIYGHGRTRRKWNACVKRFNRTLQEELVSAHHDLLFTDLGAVNRAMWDNLSGTTRNAHTPESAYESPRGAGIAHKTGANHSISMIKGCSYGNKSLTIGAVP